MGAALLGSYYVHKGLTMNKRTCPLGHTCPECLWEVEVQRQNIQTQELAVEKTCAITEAVRAQVSTFQMTHSLGSAMESARNASIENQDKMLKLIGGGL